MAGWRPVQDVSLTEEHGEQKPLMQAPLKPQVGELKQRNHELSEALDAAQREGSAATETLRAEAETLRGEAETLRGQLAGAQGGAEVAAAALERERSEREAERGAAAAELAEAREKLAAAEEAAKPGTGEAERIAAQEQQLAEVSLLPGHAVSQGPCPGGCGSPAAQMSMLLWRCLARTHACLHARHGAAPVEKRRHELLQFCRRILLAHRAGMAMCMTARSWHALHASSRGGTLCRRECALGMRLRMWVPGLGHHEWN